jgi:biopolymer transport protein ExbB
MLLHLIPILIVGAISLAIIVERAYYLYGKSSINQQLLVSELKQKVIANDINGALQLCAANVQSPCAKVVKAGLLRASRDNKQIQAAMEIVAHECIAMVRKRIGYLAMLANVATLFGLLGTIGGLIKSFAAVANVDAATKSILLSEGISTSMNATATGLAVAIPAMIAFSVLQSKANRVTENIESCAMITYDLLSARVYRDEWEKDQKPSLELVKAA